VHAGYSARSRNHSGGGSSSGGGLSSGAGGGGAGGGDVLRTFHFTRNMWRTVMEPKLDGFKKGLQNNDGGGNRGGGGGGSNKKKEKKVKASTDYTAEEQALVDRFEVESKRAAEAGAKKKAEAKKANSSTKGKGKGKGKGGRTGDRGREAKIDEGFPIGSQVVEPSNFLRLCEVIGPPEQRQIDVKGKRGVVTKKTIYEQRVKFTDSTTKACDCMDLRAPGILDAFEAGLSELEQTFLKVGRYGYIFLYQWVQCSATHGACKMHEAKHAQHAFCSAQHSTRSTQHDAV
jgi:hypothetical protein